MSYDKWRKFVDEDRALMEAHEASLPPGPPSDVMLGPLGATILANPQWQHQDHYPNYQVCAEELEELLSFAKSQGVYPRYFCRVNRHFETTKLCA